MPTAHAEGTTLGVIDNTLQLELQHAEQLLKGIYIPPCPAVLVAVLEEQGQPEPDIERIAELISSDVALAAATLKVVNSSFFGLSRRIGSIHHAVRLLGVGNVVNIVTGLMLHEAFKGLKGRFMDTFWTSANRMAASAALVAQRQSNVPSDEAYAAGLLSNCGVPMMLRRFPDTYEAVYAEAMEVTHQTGTAYENEHLGTDHAVIGYLVGRTWKLPASICECILHHHDTHDYFSRPEGGDDHLRTILGIVKVAQVIQRRLDGYAPGYDWEQVGPAVMAYLELDEADLEDLEQHVAQIEL